MGGEDRGAAMAASVVRTARTLGVPEGELGGLSRAHALAMAPRVAALDDDHHPLFLHPGRTVLILLRDVACVDATLLCAAALLETEDAHLRPAPEAADPPLPTEVLRLLGAVPAPWTESLAEELVTAEESVRLIALAERLDHFRHAHLREADDRWREELLDEGRRVYVPVAHRTHARLAQRYEHWCRTFARRLDAR